MKLAFSSKGITALLGRGLGRERSPRPRGNQALEAFLGLSDHQLRDLGVQRDQLAARRTARSGGGDLQ